MNYFCKLPNDLQFYFLKNNPEYFKILINIEPFNKLSSIRNFKYKNYKCCLWNIFNITCSILCVFILPLKINLFIIPGILGIFHKYHPKPELFIYKESIGYINQGYWNPKDLNY